MSGGSKSRSRNVKHRKQMCCWNMNRGGAVSEKGHQKSHWIQANTTAQSINLKVWGRGSVPPSADFLRDHGAAQGAALLPVKPQSDALVAEHVLHGRKGVDAVNALTCVAITEHASVDLPGRGELGVLCTLPDRWDTCLQLHCTDS